MFVSQNRFPHFRMKFHFRFFYFPVVIVMISKTKRFKKKKKRKKKIKIYKKNIKISHLQNGFFVAFFGYFFQDCNFKIAFFHWKTFFSVKRKQFVNFLVVKQICASYILQYFCEQTMVLWIIFESILFDLNWTVINHVPHSGLAVLALNAPNKSK